ncbi:MAG: flavin reductase family protein [Gemmataceae bacterium]|nr:flavin reductase family protein [Gemmataceae bacterium]
MVELPSYALPLGRLPSGLFILTAGVGDQATGMLASWVQQCSFEPPRISVAVRPGRYCGSLLGARARFVVNIIAAGHNAYLVHFGKGFAPGEPAFVGQATTMLSDGLLTLNDALGYLECRVVDRHAAGDHDLIIADVEGGRMIADGSPFVHIRKSGLHY